MASWEAKVTGIRLSKLIRSLTILAVISTAPAAFGQLMPVSIQDTDQVSSINIVLTRFGPSPRTVTVSANALTLMVQNHSGIQDETASLRPQSSANGDGSPGTLMPSLWDLHSTGQQHRDYKVLKLKPGNYVMTFLAHPDWLVSITVTSEIVQRDAK